MSFMSAPSVQMLGMNQVRRIYLCLLNSWLFYDPFGNAQSISNTTEAGAAQGSLTHYLWQVILSHLRWVVDPLLAVFGDRSCRLKRCASVGTKRACQRQEWAQPPGKFFERFHLCLKTEKAEETEEGDTSWDIQWRTIIIYYWYGLTFEELRVPWSSEVNVRDSILICPTSTQRENLHCGTFYAIFGYRNYGNRQRYKNAPSAQPCSASAVFAVCYQNVIKNNALLPTTYDLTFGQLCSILKTTPAIEFEVNKSFLKKF